MQSTLKVLYLLVQYSGYLQMLYIVLLYNILQDIWDEYADRGESVDITP